MNDVLLGNVSGKKLNNFLQKKSNSYHYQSQSFEKFLSWTDEKQKIAQAVLEVVKEKRDSLLDIGAGNGIITNFLKNNFNRITLVEPDPSLFKTLQNKFNVDGHTLINLPFEQAIIEDKFDVILASHIFHLLLNPTYEIYRIRKMLKDSGVFLLIDNKHDCEVWNFYYKYGKYVFDENSIKPAILCYKDSLDMYMNLFEKLFRIEETVFNATFSIPSIDDAINIFDFIYGKNFSQIKHENIIKIRNELKKEYGLGPINFKMQQVMYLCYKH